MSQEIRRVVQAFTRRDRQSWFLDRDVMQHLLPPFGQEGTLAPPGPVTTECGREVLGFEEGWLDTQLGDGRNCPACMVRQIQRVLLAGRRVDVMRAGCLWRLVAVEAKASEYGPKSRLRFDAAGPGVVVRWREGEEEEWLMLARELVEVWREAVGLAAEVAPQQEVSDDD